MNSSSGPKTWVPYKYGAILVLAVAALSSQLMSPVVSESQHSTAAINPTSPIATASPSSVDRTITNICEARRRDGRGTIPIDEMAYAPPLPLNDLRVSGGKARAIALLPIAKRLVPFAVRRVAIANGVEPRNAKWIITRVEAVNNILPDPALHDNSSWQASKPDTIFFGTVFLAGLRSDEAMLAVLAHELTHAINGTDRALEPVFMRLRSRALQEQMIGENALIELACEMVGLETVRDYISQTKGRRPGMGLRLARALQKDCVRTDLSDENHLSPRETMRMLLQFDVALVNALSEEKPRALKNAPPKKKPTRRKPIKKIHHK